MDKIIDLMMNGNWTEAQEKFIALNISPAEFTRELANYNKDELKDLALLGFYCRKDKKC